MIAPATCDLGVNEFVESAEERVTELVKGNPTLSMLLVFGVGIGVGAVLAEVVAASSRPSETTSERVKRQICEALNIKF